MELISTTEITFGCLLPTRSAHSFFDHGVSFLPEGQWDDHYALSLELFQSAAKCAFALGDLTNMIRFSTEILSFGKSLEDKLNTLYLNTIALAFTSVPDSLDKSLTILSELGEKLQTNMTEADVKSHIDITVSLLSNYSDEQLLNYHKMEDPLKLSAMKFLTRLEIGSQQARPALQPIVTLKMVNLSLKHGLSPMSPIGFTYFGQLLARLGNVQEGNRYVKIAKKLLGRLGSKEVAGEVLALGTQITCFAEPVVAANEGHLEGYSVAMAAGDLNNALFNLILHGAGIYWNGVNLEKVRESHTKYCAMIEQHNHFTWLLNFIPSVRTVLILAGSTEEEVKRTTFIQGEASLLEKNPHCAMTRHFQKFHLHFLFREYDQMKDAAEKFYSYDVIKSWSLLYFHTMQSFQGALVSFWIFRTSGDPKWIDRGSKAVLEMKQWALSSSWNFESKLYLMEAELAYAITDFDRAKILYDKAISSAKEHR